MTTLNRTLVVTISTLMACLLVAFVLRTFQPIYLLGLLGIPVLIFFMNHQRLLFQMVIVTFFSGLTVPGLPGGLFLTHVFALLYIGVVFFGYALRKQSVAAPDGFTWAILLFALNLAVIASLRGLGFRVFGDTNWGGMRYVEVFIMLLFLLNAKAVSLTPQAWRKTLLWALGLSTLPFLSELVFMLSGGRIWQQYRIVNVNMATIASYIRDVSGNELVRFQSANRLGAFVMLTGVFFIFHRPRRITIFALLYFLAILLVGFSGHRSGLFDLLFFPWIAGMVYLKKHLLRYVAYSSFGFLFVLGGVYLIASFLPLPFQRAVSWLPGIQVDAAAMRDAEGTMEWRLNLWDAAFDEVRQNPEFLLIGKGLTYSSGEYLALELSYQLNEHFMWGVITSTYHQGFISLLILTGIPGLILGTVFLIMGLHYNRPQKLDASFGPFFQVVHLILFSYVILVVFKFYTVYGDLQVSWPVLCFWFALLDNLRYSSTLYANSQTAFHND